MEGKVKCKICGKVGVANADKGLRRHLRLIHNISVSKDFCVGDYFEPTDPDAVIEIFSDSRKVYRKKKNKKWNKWNRNHSEGKNPFVRIIYTPMEKKKKNTENSLCMY